MKDLTNQKFNRLTAIRPVGHDKNRVVIWEFRCDCGKIKNITGSKVRLGYTKSCGCFKNENIKARYGQKHQQWDGYEEISKSFYSRMENGAKLRKLKWELDIEFLWKLYIRQNKKCALSGLNINMPIHVRQLRDKNNDNLASLDRIDPKRGYEKDNVQWVCKRINYMKHTQTEESFLKYVTAIFKYKLI